MSNLPKVGEYYAAPGTDWDADRKLYIMATHYIVIERVNKEQMLVSAKILNNSPKLNGKRLNYNLQVYPFNAQYVKLTQERVKTLRSQGIIKGG